MEISKEMLAKAKEAKTYDELKALADANGVEITKKIIAEEKERSALVIITCHDQEILEDVCDVIYTIEHGKITNEKIMQAEANSE